MWWRRPGTSITASRGKSTLVRALTGTDPDRLIEEKQRGLTIDLGFAWTTLPSAGAVEFVDWVEVVGTRGRSEPFRVRGIQALGRPVARAPAGTRAALNLAGAPRQAARRGDALVRAGQWPGAQQVDATLTVLPALEHDVTDRGAYPVATRRRAPWRLHREPGLPGARDEPQVGSPASPGVGRRRGDGSPR